jgi:hypothetical protein
MLFAAIIIAMAAMATVRLFLCVRDRYRPKRKAR